HDGAAGPRLLQSPDAPVGSDLQCRAGIPARPRRCRAAARQGGGARLGRLLVALVGTGRGSGMRDVGGRPAGQTLGRGTAAIRSARRRISAYGALRSCPVAASRTLPSARCAGGSRPGTASSGLAAGTFLAHGRLWLPANDGRTPPPFPNNAARRDLSC